MQEFRPEQVKRYLAREVIGRLPNAAVIDLSQFAGLCDLEAREARRRKASTASCWPRSAPRPIRRVARPYEVSVLGRWSENDRAARRAPLGSASRRHAGDAARRAGAASSRSTTATVRARRC